MECFEEWWAENHDEWSYDVVVTAKAAWEAALTTQKAPVAKLQCSDRLSNAVFTKEHGVLSLRTPEGWLLWHSCKLDGVTLADLLKEAEGNLKKLKETQGR